LLFWGSNAFIHHDIFRFFFTSPHHRLSSLHKLSTRHRSDSKDSCRKIQIQNSQRTSAWCCESILIGFPDWFLRFTGDVWQCNYLVCKLIVLLFVFPHSNRIFSLHVSTVQMRGKCFWG
jgi:hypothetical protein